jgi:FkbM family methyltransferase
MREAVNRFLSMFNLRLVSNSNWVFLTHLIQFSAGSRWTRGKKSGSSGKVLPDSLYLFVQQFLPYSFSQLQQDLFVSWCLESAEKNYLISKRERFFVEFGACDGIRLSNTFFLEKNRSWSGLLCEPARNWRDQLTGTRTCAKDYRCVSSKTGEKLQFTEALEPEFSTISEYIDQDSHHRTRIGGNVYEVESVSLIDLLNSHGTPTVIDYLSMDTEGSEYEILKNFDFSKYSFQVITVEHNYTSNRELLHGLLSSNGYVRVLESVSLQDDWYVATELTPLFR